MANADLQGRSVIIAMVADAKLGPTFNAHDPYEQSAS